MAREQVKLPFSILYGITIQGIKIRIGRSFVTLLGVVCGIAFLMSVLAGIVIKKGIHQEEGARIAIGRMYNLLTSEAGLPKGRIYGIVQTGPLNDMEKRLLLKISEQDAMAINCYKVMDTLSQAGVKVNFVDLSDVGKQASAIIVMGNGEIPTVKWVDVLSSTRQKVVALSRKNMSISTGTLGTVLQLDKKINADELIKIQKELRKEKARNTWILVISLCVTIIGILNSMLMSVTERFREIGTMKCLGALSGFIRQLFLIESSIIGFIGSFLGAFLGVLFSLVVYSITYGISLVINSVDLLGLSIYLVIAIIAGVIFSVIAAIYPANFAARMMPANALRSNI